MTPDLPDSPLDDWADIEGSFDEVLEASAQQGMRRLSGETVTPDLPIPEAAIEAGAEAYWERMRYAPSEPDWPGLVAKDSEEAEVYREAALTVLAAALPHLRSLQVETQVRAGYAIGRKEALDDVGRGLGCVLQTHETYVDIQMDAGLWRDIAATRDADRKLAVDDRSLQERQNLLRVPTHDIDGNRIPEWEREYIARDIGKGDPNG